MNNFKANALLLLVMVLVFAPVAPALIWGVKALPIAAACVVGAFALLRKVIKSI